MNKFLNTVLRSMQNILFHSNKKYTARVKTMNRASGPITRGAPKIYNSYNDAPAAPGLYRFTCSKCKEAAYIGQTANIRRRFYQHLKKGDKNICPKCGNNLIFKAQEAYVKYEHDALMNSEKKQIKKHKPHLNRRTGGGGRRPG